MGKLGGGGGGTIISFLRLHSLLEEREGIGVEVVVANNGSGDDDGVGSGNDEHGNAGGGR